MWLGQHAKPMSAGDHDIVLVVQAKTFAADERFVPADTVVGLGVADVVLRGDRPVGDVGNSVAKLPGRVPATEFFQRLVVEHGTVDRNESFFPRHVLHDQRIGRVFHRAVDLSGQVGGCGDEVIVEQELRMVGEDYRFSFRSQNKRS